MEIDRTTEILADEFKQKKQYIDNIISLLDEGNTIPFIARYRKEMHGTMDDQLIREIADRLQYLRNLDKRREEIRSSLVSQDKLSGELDAAIENAATLAALEDIYRPYRQKRRTRATAAREKGLEPLAEKLFKQDTKSGNIDSLATEYVNEENGVPSVEEALSGAADIIAEDISCDPEIRKALKELINRRGGIRSEATGEEDSVYRMYYDYSEAVSRIQKHRILAINRGEKEGFLKVHLDLDEVLALDTVKKHVIRGESISRAFVEAAAEDAYDRLIFPSIEREIRSELSASANEQAIKMFAVNLKPLLMQPPVRDKVTMGFDPAYRTGCKIAVVDPTGKVLETGVVYPTPPHNKKDEAAAALSRMIKKHGVTAIAIGNGTASKESEIFIAELIKDMPGVAYMVVNEAGASVYSASRLAADEFPDYDVSLRSAVSIARRLQDPLAELV
ncbi:MAG: RNA-binding transcriptional accessory protein, partial [Oscillospiraceae bacterium]|nr:RNA-binding transcriptional accessory protein [Oscillospiraceae bacterium]